MGQAPTADAGLGPAAVRRFCKYLAVTLLAFGIAGAGRPASAAGIAGDALRFDGGSDGDDDVGDFGDFVNIPDDLSLSLGSLTLEAWILVEGGTVFLRRPFIAKGLNRGNYQMDIRGQGSGSAPGTLAYSHQVAGGNFVCCSGTPIVFGEWTHVAATYDGGTETAKTYINGQLVGQLQQAGTSPLQNMNDLLLGHAEGTPLFFRGLMDEVRIWNVVRTPEQIAQFHNKIVGQSSPGLVANYHFDEGFDEFGDPVQEVLDSATKPALVLPNDGTLGADSGVNVAEEPERVDSTAPLVASVAECPFEGDSPSEVCVPGTEDTIPVFFSEETSFAVAPARCACSTPLAEPLSIEACSKDPTASVPCYPPGNRARDSHALSLDTFEFNPRCKKVCYDIGGMEVCDRICK